MKRFDWQIYLGLSLVAISVFFYFVHYAIFQDTHHIFIYLIGDIAFVPIEVLFVTLIVHRLLDKREKRSMMKKLNMVIGTFFCEVGIKLLKCFSQFDCHFNTTRENLLVSNDWTGQKFSDTARRLKDYDYQIDSQKGDLEDLRNFLLAKRDFLLRLLENSNLLEHESFTELLWAISHLTEELVARADTRKLSTADYAHFSGDIKRAYIVLISEWLQYMKHLKDQYPYLFSFALRTNPFDLYATPEIK
ncbi:MAG: hypothetical protein HS132_12065 [Planctomycetia bacterium]|nr:hypothetical protein [Planctomycetia bacterium]